MKKYRLLLLLPLILFLVIALLTKPDDKACIIGGVKAVWGNLTPNPEDKPDLFEDFMNLNSPSVRVKDWVLFKQVLYKVSGEETTVAYGAFKNVFAAVKPIEYSNYIPKMPERK
jgi:hypothetical protein